MSESKIQNKILQFLRAEGAVAIKVLSANRNGTADILCCYKGRFLAVEVKAKGKMSNISPLQIRYLIDVEQAGGLAICVDSVEKLKEYLDGIN